MQDTVMFKNGLPYYTDLAALPQARVMRSAGTVRELWNAVSTKRTRGTITRSVLAAMLMRSCAERCDCKSQTAARYELLKTAKALLELPDCDALLKNAVADMLCAVEKSTDIQAIKKAATYECESLTFKSTDICRRIGINTLKALGEAHTVMTVGEGGALTAVRYGTALSFAYVAKQEKRHFKLLCCRGESDVQNAFLTHCELLEQSIEHTVIADADTANVLQNNFKGAVVAPLDKKIGGILQAAICAKYYGIPFYICAPHDAIFDMRCELSVSAKYIADGIPITAFITECGLFGIKT